MLLPVCFRSCLSSYVHMLPLVCSRSVRLQEEIEYLDEEDLGFDPNAEDMEDWSSGEEYSGSGKRACCCWGAAAGQALLQGAAAGQALLRCAVGSGIVGET